MAAQDPDRDDSIAGINITPLVDIAPVLLVVFMVTAKVMVSPAVAMIARVAFSVTPGREAHALVGP